jgi:hypothetical protein
MLIIIISMAPTQSQERDIESSQRGKITKREAGEVARMQLEARVSPQIKSDRRKPHLGSWPLLMSRACGKCAVRGEQRSGRGKGAWTIETQVRIPLHAKGYAACRLNNTGVEQHARRLLGNHGVPAAQTERAKSAETTRLQCSRAVSHRSENLSLRAPQLASADMPGSAQDPDHWLGTRQRAPTPQCFVKEQHIARRCEPSQRSL